MLMTTLFMHHYYIPKVDYGHTYITNFHEEFDNADHIGTEAILETYNRLFEEWKSNKTYLRELMLVLNHRIGFWDDMYCKEPTNKQHLKFSLLYLDLFEKVHKYIKRMYYNETRKDWEILE